MNFYAKILNENAAPLAGAPVQRLYPNHGNYSGVLLTDAAGVVNMPVPDNSYLFLVNIPGYMPRIVNFSGVPNNNVTAPVIVKLERAAVEPPPVVVTQPVSNPVVVEEQPDASGVPLWVWGAGAVLVFMNWNSIKKIF